MHSNSGCSRSYSESLLTQSFPFLTALSPPILLLPHFHLPKLLSAPRGLIRMLLLIVTPPESLTGPESALYLPAEDRSGNLDVLPKHQHLAPG